MNNIKFSTGGGNRQSNFELLRIVAMLLVLIVHTDFYALGEPGAAEVTAHPVSSYMRYAVESLALVCVNVYVLISGYFRIKVRFRSVCNFLFMIVFWRLLMLAVLTGVHCATGAVETLTLRRALSSLIPGYHDWFVAAYLLLMTLSPMLNAYIAGVRAGTLRLFTLLFILLQLVFSWTIPVFESFVQGYSVLSFIGLYLLGASLRGMRLSFIPTCRRGVILYVGFSLLVALFVFGLKYFMGESWIVSRVSVMFMAYNGFNVLLGSVLLFVAFSRLNFTGALINRVAASSFAVYLLHQNPLVRVYYKEVCRYLFDNFGTVGYICLISAFVLTVYVIATLLDRVRLALWRVAEPHIDAPYRRVKAWAVRFSA